MIQDQIQIQLLVWIGVFSESSILCFNLLSHIYSLYSKFKQSITLSQKAPKYSLFLGKSYKIVTTHKQEKPYAKVKSFKK